MSQTINILLTGATGTFDNALGSTDADKKFAGYIGGSVLSALLSHLRQDEFDITVLVRSEVKASLFERVGVTPVVGSYNDSALLKNLASQADVVIACVRTYGVSLSQRILNRMYYFRLMLTT